MDLSIVILSYNTKTVLKDCIDSILKNSLGLSYEIIVVDNASKDGSVAMLSSFVRKEKRVRFILNKVNVGFAAGNNQGISVAKGKVVLLLNSDTLVNDNCLGEMVSWLERHKDVGAMSPALKNKDASFQGTGGYFPTLVRVFLWMFFLDDIPFMDFFIKPYHPMHAQSPFYKGTRNYLHASEIDWITGAFMMIRKEALEEVGGLDEDYFMYVEDTDLCFRIKKAGWRIWYKPQWNIVHLGGASSTSEFPIISEFKGLRLFYKKNMPSWQYPVVIFFLKCGALLRIILFGLFKGKDSAKTYAKALTLN